MPIPATQNYGLHLPPLDTADWDILLRENAEKTDLALKAVEDKADQALAGSGGGFAPWGAITLADGQTVEAAIAELTIPAADANILVVQFAIKRGTNLLHGTLTILHDGIEVSHDLVCSEKGDVGIVLGARLNGGNLEVVYTSTATGEAIGAKARSEAVLV